MVLNDIVESFEKALLRLEEAYLRAKSEEQGEDFDFFRDSTITYREEIANEIFTRMNGFIDILKQVLSELRYKDL